MKKRLLSLICILALCLGLLPVSAFAEPVDNGTAAVNSPQAENVEPPEGTVVWITGAGYLNIPYQYTKMGSENVLLPVGTAIFYQNTEVETFNAGTPYAENGEKTVSLTDQSNLAAIDCWTAAGTGSTHNPIVPLEFSSQLAKVSFVIDPGAYEDGSSVEVTALNTATGYQCGSDHPNSIEASTTAGDIHLAVTKLEDGTWQAEGLLVPGTAPDIAITYGGKTDTVSLASVFVNGFSAGKVYSARLVPDAADGQWTLSSPEEEARGTWSANFYGGNFIFLYLEDLVPKTICGANVIMDEPDSFGITPETALTGKVTVSLDVEEVQMKDLLFSSPLGLEMVYQEGTENTFMYRDMEYYVLFKTSDATEWSADPISLIPGETKTVLLYIGEEYEIYYSIDITRPERPQIIGQPQDTAVTEGEAAAFAVEATGGSLTYQWQQSTDGGVSWTDIDDAKAAEYTTPQATISMNGYQYRCIVTSDTDKVTSTPAVLTVQHDLKKTEAKDATCTADGNIPYWYCESCGKYFSDKNGENEIAAPIEIPALGHSIIKVDGKEPTCEDVGYETYWKCEFCDKYFSDENATAEITLTETVVPAAGHGETELKNQKDATCTEAGYTGDKVCAVCGEILEKGETIPKLAHDYKDGKCTVCGAIDSTFKPVITDGANSTWQKGTGDGLSFTSNAAFADFLKVQVDGKDLDTSSYTVKEGSTIVNLKASYLETLSVGKHTLAVVSKTGTASTEFTIKAAAAVNDDTESPQTGDNSNLMLWIALMLVSGGALFTMLFINKKKSVDNR